MSNLGSSALRDPTYVIASPWLMCAVPALFGLVLVLCSALWGWLLVGPGSPQWLQLLMALAVWGVFIIWLFRPRMRWGKWVVSIFFMERDVILGWGCALIALASFTVFYPHEGGEDTIHNLYRLLNFMEAFAGGFLIWSSIRQGPVYGWRATLEVILNRNQKS